MFINTLEAVRNVDPVVQDYARTLEPRVPASTPRL